MRRILPLAGWLGATFFAWQLLILVELALTVDKGLPTVGDLAYSARLTSDYVGWSAAILGGLHLVVAVVTRLAGTHAAVLGSAAVVGGLGIFVGLNQSAFLTSGDGIATTPYVNVLRGAILVVLAAGLLTVWLWHLAGVRRSLVEAEWPWLGAPPAALAWTALGLIAVAACFVLLVRWLDFYAHFALFVTIPTCVIASTLVFRLISHNERSLALVTAAAAIVFAAAHTSGNAPSHALLSRSKLAVYSAIIGSLRAGTASGSVPRIDVSDPASLRCESRSLRQANTVPVPRPQRRNVILISLDAFRADVVDETRDGNVLAPRIREFASQAVFSPRAQSSYPATVFALGGAFTGLSPSELLYAPGHPKNIFALTAEHFDRQRAVLPAHSWFRTRVIQPLLIQTAERIDTGEDASAVTDALLGQLAEARAAQESLMIWAHYYDAHAPHDPPPGFERGNSEPNRYAGEIAYLDTQLGRVFDALAADGWLDDSLIIVFSDHGEALGERGYQGHHVYLNGWITDIPLITRFPGNRAERLSAPRSILDIAPTVLDFAGVPTAGELDGISIFDPAQRGNQARPVFAEAFPVRGSELFALANEPIVTFEDLQARLRRTQGQSVDRYEPKAAVVLGNERFIVSRTSGHAELYDRVTDPTERTNLVAGRPKRVEALMAVLHEQHRDWSRRIYCRLATPEGRRQFELAP